MSHYKSERARAAGFVVAAFATFALAGCSSDKTEPEPGAGNAGVGGAGATAGVGGGAGSSAGTSTAGSAGRSAGGTGGSSGSASTTGGAGTGGTAAGRGGQAGGAAAGSGGTAGGIGLGGEAGGRDDGGTSGLGGSGSGGLGSGGAAAGAGGSGGAGGGGTLTITSPNHAEGMKFADKYTCKLAGFSGSLMPELVWSGAPAGTQSFAITFIDTTIAAKPTPMDMNGYHWAVYDIPKETMGLPEEFKTPTGTMKQTGTFLGPCPNVGGGSVTDQYEFTIYALAEASITVTGSGTTAVKNAKMMLETTHLAKATLKGSSDASPP